MKIPDWLKEALSTYELRTDPHSELEIFEAIRNAKKQKGDVPDDEEWSCFLAESSAFGFMTRRTEPSVWNTYFGPMATFTSADGTEVRNPDIAQLDDNTVAHWKERAASVKNPIMSARYADLVWDLTKAITKGNPDYKYAQIAIDQYMHAVENKLNTMEIYAVHWLERAFSLAAALKDDKRTREVITLVFVFYDLFASPQKTGVWIFAFDTLYSRRDLLTQDEADRIISDLEKMLAITSGGGKPEEFDPFGAQAAADRLAKHYLRLKDKANVDRVVKQYGGAFEKISKEASPMLAQSWLLPVIERYEQEGLKQDAERLRILSEEKGKHIGDDLKELTASFSISQAELEGFINEIMANDLDGALTRIAVNFTPNVDETRKNLREISNIAPLMSLFSVVKVSPDGRPSAKVGSLEEDPDGRLHMEIGNSVSTYVPFLVKAIDVAREKYAPTPEQIIQWLAQSPVFHESRKEFLAEGLRAYESGDYLKSIHVLVPQVEHTLRNLLVLMQIPTTKAVPRHPGITDVKSMNQVLEDERVREALTENMWRYLTVLYIDRRGMNIRNDLAHGLLDMKMFNRAVADRVFHSLLVLGLIRVVPKPDADDSGQGRTAEPKRAIKDEAEPLTSPG
jgi:lysyl-tRNA synthetase class 1